MKVTTSSLRHVYKPYSSAIGRSVDQSWWHTRLNQEHAIPYNLEHLAVVLVVRVHRVLMCWTGLKSHKTQTEAELPDRGGACQSSEYWRQACVGSELSSTRSHSVAPIQRQALVKHPRSLKRVSFKDRKNPWTDVSLVDHQTGWVRHNAVVQGVESDSCIVGWIDRVGRKFNVGSRFTRALA